MSQRYIFFVEAKGRLANFFHHCAWLPRACAEEHIFTWHLLDLGLVFVIVWRVSLFKQWGIQHGKFCQIVGGGLGCEHVFRISLYNENGVP